MSILLTLGWTCASEPVLPLECVEHPLYPALQEARGDLLPVIVTLTVRDDEDLEAVQSQLIEALEGTTFVIHRRMTVAPLLALRVGEEAFCRLVTNDRVADLQRDELARPHG